MARGYPLATLVVVQILEFGIDDIVLAGASTVIATTRTVDDAAAAELMQAFHRALAGGATALEALRGAQRTRPATDETMLHARAWVP